MCAIRIRRGSTNFEDALSYVSNRELFRKLADTEPRPIPGFSNAWIYKESVYAVDGFSGYSDEEIKLSILEFIDRERKKFERLRRKHQTPETKEQSKSHPRIPEQVRIEVWRRDEGKCANCGSREKLEYDHIIPISKGGSTTTRNIELLCEKCNRSKGATIE